MVLIKLGDILEIRSKKSKLIDKLLEQNEKVYIFKKNKGKISYIGCINVNEIGKFEWDYVGIKKKTTGKYIDDDYLHYLLEYMFS